MNDGHSIEEFDDNTKSILMQGMSAEAAQASMGLRVVAGGNAELAETMRREQDELAGDMIAKNKEAERKRAALVTGGAGPEVPRSSLEQKPVKRKGKRGMKRQEASTVVTPDMAAPKPAHSAIQPVQTLPEQPDPGTGLHTPRFTQDDLALIDSVKASHARARDNFVEHRDTVHPGAYDARALDPRYAMAMAKNAAMMDPEYARERLRSPLMMAPQLAPNKDGRNPNWSLDAEARAIEHAQLVHAAGKEPGNPARPDEGDTLREQGMAGYWDDARRHYDGQAPVGRVPMGNAENTRAFLEATGNMPGNSRKPAMQDETGPGLPPEYVDASMVRVPPRRPFPALPREDEGIPGNSRKPAMQGETGPGLPPEYVDASTVRVPPHRQFRVSPREDEVPCVRDGNYDAFTEITGWPSHGIFYPGKVYGQSLKTIDVFMLSDTTDDDVNSTMTAILGRRLQGLPSPEDILTCDEEYLLYWLRASSFPENEAGLPKIKFDCPHCKRQYRTMAAAQLLPEVSFSDLLFKTETSPESVAAMHAEKGYVEFRAYDGRECNVYLKRRKHDRIVDDYIAAWETEHRDSFPGYRKEGLSIASVMEIEDCENLTDKMEYIESYPVAERRKLFMSVLNSQIVSKTFVRVRCPGCGGTATLPYPFRIRNYVASL